MGCTDEKSVANRPLRKLNRNYLNLNNNPNTNHNNKEKENNNSSKINYSNEEDEKDLPKYMENEQEQILISKKNRNESEENSVKEGNKFVYNGESKEDEKEEEEEEEEEGEENNESDDLSEVNREMIRELSPYLQSRVNPNFNFPEVKEDKFVGKGLRKMKGYISPIPKEELEKRRISFWGTRIEGDSMVWTFLKELCELPEGEEDNMKAMLEANEITPLKKCINVTYDKSGEVYEIPNYCINDPVLYDLPENHIQKPEKKYISFHARKGTQQIKIRASNTTSIDKIKVSIGKKLQIDENKIRMFFRGKEMKNGNELWVYNIEDDCVVIVMYS